MTDPYKVLGVSKDATLPEIKVAYRTLAKKYHPDITGGDKTLEKRFIEVDEAYNILSDADKRAQYDAERDRPPPQRHTRTQKTAYEGFHFEDILGDLFGGGVGYQRQPQSLDINAQLPVAPWTAALGGSIEFSLSGKKITVKIPEKATNGQKLRLKGQGNQDPKGAKGDLVLEIILKNPETLTARQKELYEQLSRC